MAKRPLIYELIDTVTGRVFYSSENKEEAFNTVKKMLVNEPNLTYESTFLIIQNGKNVKVLARFTGEALREILEDEE